MPASAPLSILTLLGVTLVLLTTRPPAAVAQAAPVYRLAVHVDLDAHTVSGELLLELDPGDPRLGAELWFHLPPNRFVEDDPRGSRRQLDSLNFAQGFNTEEKPFDPIWPDGFSEGHIRIERVETADGVALPFELAPNPAMPLGFSVQDGLMRVPLAGAGGTHRFRIRFTIALPERNWDGWSDAGVLLEQWHPLLANRTADGWDFDVFAPRAGRYAADVTLSREGRLFLGHGWSAEVQPGEVAHMPLDDQPMRAFPLVFVQNRPVLAEHGYEVSVYSYYQPGNERLGELAVLIGSRFLRYVRQHFRLPPPNTRIAIVEVDLPPGDIRTVGSLVLVPRVYYKSNSLMDRVFVAQLSRAMAQVWFGEAVWSNRDTQTWLHLGLSGYLALDFFTTLYGWDAGIHDVMDWLQPRYREHFFEAPVRSLIRGKKDAPLMISLQQHPSLRAALIVAHNKAPLVLRSLDYVVGREAFARGLNALYFRHRFTEVTEDTLQQELSAQAGRDLQPFFSQWFDATPEVNFTVEHWEQEHTPTGYRVYVDVRRTDLLLLPVDVEVVTETGDAYVQRWRADGDSARLVFNLPVPAAGAAIDPEEHWLEDDRKDNYTDLHYRVRPLFDWPKQRDILVALRGTAGGNTTDGNYIGIGADVILDEDIRFRAIPIYGERTGLVNYEASMRWQHLLLPKLDIDLSLSKLNGTTSQTLSVTYRLVDLDDYRFYPAIDLNATTVKESSFVDRYGVPVFQPEGPANNGAIRLWFWGQPSEHYRAIVNLSVTDSRPSYGSDFDYTSYAFALNQHVSIGSSHLVKLVLRRNGTEGSPPLQSRFGLGGPGALRGYPRLLELSTEETATASLDYGLVVSRAVVGATAQMRRLTLFMFGDVGRGWNNDEHHETRPQRQDLGLGLELLINLLRLDEFTARVDVAYPVNDEEYKDPQIILFGVLSF